MENSDDPEDCETIDWREEAEAVIKDVGFGVKQISVSSVLPSTDNEIFFNIETKESQKICVELSSRGFRVVSDHFDTVDESYPDLIFYETPYALLNNYSYAFKQSFSEELSRKLSQLAESQT